MLGILKTENLATSNHRINIFMHPLAPKLSTLSDDELTQKMGELNRHLGRSMATGNHYLSNQIRSLYEDYQIEQQRRQRAYYDRMNKDSDEDLDELIDIN